MVKNLPVNAGDTGDVGLSPRSGKFLGKRNGNLVQCSCLENPMDRGAWQAIVHGVARVRHDLATKPPPPLFKHIIAVYQTEIFHALIATKPPKFELEKIDAK